ncbi:unnamed protein product [Prunus armeniaca]
MMNSNRKQATHGSAKWRRVAAVPAAFDTIFLELNQKGRFNNSDNLRRLRTQSDIDSILDCLHCLVVEILIKNGVLLDADADADAKVCSNQWPIMGLGHHV